ncbi:hypothetical protein ACHAWO_008401 [Cyclotella atomus]|uniref:Coiled-coil domain-containing protein 153 n=1 Tax=Cyclotella atomus TaxID=382360 RepID=A0ABD3PX05_9STRA
MALDMEELVTMRIFVLLWIKQKRSFASNDKRSMQQLFDKQLSATEEHYEKRLQSLEVLYKKQLNKTQNQLHSTNLELQSTKSKIDSLKLQHKLTIKRMQTIHADRLESKKEQLRQADELVAGMQEMFEEMTKEVMDATTESEDAMKQMDRLKSKAVSAHAKYIEHKLLANELNDELNTTTT